ncbi:hypothetical protein T02_739 [Trichinella nativa]|uniref:Uncharacterized protein n=1 Tax=Trichinella nativa TaxID=6335 RepID=A0A0V1LQE7_9BILA|nr:hypothetical protein T02_739 [Trichinella nativa]
MILMLRPMLPTVFGGNLNKGPAESSYKHNICDTFKMYVENLIIFTRKPMQIDGDKADISMSVFGLNSYPGNSTSGDSIVICSQRWWPGTDGAAPMYKTAYNLWTGQCTRPSMSARCLDAGLTWKAVDDRKINKKKSRRRRRRTRSRIPTPGVSHWLVLSRPCHKAALTVRKTHFVHVSIKAKTRISIATAGSTFIHHLRNQDQGHLSADHSDNDLLPSVSTLRTTAG